MRKLFAFLVVTADGYYAGSNDEFDWPNVDEEFNEFAIRQLNSVDALLFGRVTYEFMAGFWPTEAAKQSDPAIAHAMNTVAKVVFSATLEKAEWDPSTLVRSGVAEEISKLKAKPGKELAIFGSPTFATSVLAMGLIDELRIMVHPIVLGAGKSIFKEIGDRVRLKLLRTTTFSSGNVLLCYQPVPRRSGGSGDQGVSFRE